jgi:transposase
MHLKSILNRIEWHKCFVCTRIRFVDGLVEAELGVEIEPRANSRAICSGCGQKRPAYDRLAPRRFQSCRRGISRCSSSTRCGGWTAWSAP